MIVVGTVGVLWGTVSVRKISLGIHVPVLSVHSCAAVGVNTSLENASAIPVGKEKNANFVRMNVK